MKAIGATVIRYLRSAIGHETIADPSQRRKARFVIASLTSLGGKGLALILNIISVPLVIGYLGTERYGIWITISTLAIWLNVLDLGLGNQLTNELSAAYGTHNIDQAHKSVSTTFWTLVGISVICSLFLVPLALMLDWAALLNLSSRDLSNELSFGLTIVVIVFLVQSPLLVANKVLVAYQEGAIANAWNTGSNILTFVGTVIAAIFRVDLVWLIAITLGLPLLVIIASNLWLFRRHKPFLAPSPKLFDRANWRTGLAKGASFFALQIAGLVLYQTDNVIIARYLGPESVSTYSIAYRLFNYVALIHALTLTPLWPAYSEAFAVKDWPWIKRTFKRTLILGMAGVIVASLVMVVLGQGIIQLWTRHLVNIDTTLLILLGLWTIMGAWGYSYSFLLNGLGRVRRQAIAAWGMAVLNLALSIWWVQTLGINGVIAATVVSYLCTSAWIQPLDAYLAVWHKRID